MYDVALYVHPDGKLSAWLPTHNADLPSDVRVLARKVDYRRGVELVNRIYSGVPVPKR